MTTRAAASWLVSPPRCIHASSIRSGEPSLTRSASYLHSLVESDNALKSSDASSPALTSKSSKLRPRHKLASSVSSDPGPSTFPNPSTKNLKRKPHVPAKPLSKPNLVVETLRHKLNQMVARDPPSTEATSKPPEQTPKFAANHESPSSSGEDYSPMSKFRYSTDSQVQKSQLITSEIDRPPPPHAPPTSFLSEGKSVEETGSVLKDVAPISEHNPIATLSHGLDRVLFNPGVHWLQDPRSHVYNFTPWLEKIPKVNDFAFERLTGFISSSRDKDLHIMATREQKKFAGSTSSLSGMLSHIYFLLTEYKEIDATILSQYFKHEPTTFTPGQRMPAMVKLNYEDGIYAIDSMSTEWDDPDRNILTWMGTLLENFVTKSPEEFNAFMRVESSPVENEAVPPPKKEAYRYAKSDKFVMRSQLDCVDSRLPGTGVFDIKTRACVSIRMDILNYEENAGYMIKKQHGVLESFEKEYYDLIRSAFLKYSFQVRIGNMDGVMVAYHNTERIFGFQYISLDEMDERLLGSVPGVGNKLFNHCIRLLEAILEEAVKCYPGQSLQCVVETPQPGKLLGIYIQPAEWSGEGEKPIKKLHVTVEHKLNGVPARPNAALGAIEAKWDINYKIERVDLSQELLWSDYNSMLKRKKRTLSLPSSVSLEDAEKYWENLSFNKANETVSKAFNADSFTLAQESVEKYRRLARAGRKEMERKEQLLAGLPKIVYGQGVYIPQISPFFPEPSRVKSEQVAVERQVSSTEQSFVPQESSTGNEKGESVETQPPVEQNTDLPVESSKDMSVARPAGSDIQNK
ncbi:mRNA degradation protein, mitochondrial [Psilocybe cubensis]|uniref:Pet127-domain-containing protein n=2 Tax=Psilocybe cubensis TaxID=181762 RepID=A0A8H7Y3R7_PSICU|nr:mRNA degradation protein, mitochondrial [Psilocybe cubensis]KAH9480468.1 mRNA degradation protein, mitochondrial [Psilocybe cubensis]